MNSVLLTSVLTIIGGVSIFVIGQIFLKFFIEPVHELRAQIGRITHSLIYYADVYSNPGFNTEEQAKSASRELRNLASDLMAKTTVIHWYLFWHKLRILRPKKSDVFFAHQALVGLSNGVLRGLPIGGAQPEPGSLDRAANNNWDRVEKIKTYLGLPKELLT